MVQQPNAQWAHRHDRFAREESAKELISGCFVRTKMWCNVVPPVTITDRLGELDHPPTAL